MCIRDRYGFAAFEEGFGQGGFDQGGFKQGGAGSGFGSGGFRSSGFGNGGYQEYHFEDVYKRQAMYRAMAYYLIQNQVDAADQEAIAAACQHADISICYQDGEQVVLLNGENVNAYLRTEAVGNMASVSSVVPEVRKKLVELQQKLARETDVVMDGRDIGTVVLPDADVKVYLTDVYKRQPLRWLVC